MIGITLYKHAASIINVTIIIVYNKSMQRLFRQRKYKRMTILLRIAISIISRLIRISSENKIILTFYNINDTITIVKLWHKLMPSKAISCSSVQKI